MRHARGDLIKVGLRLFIRSSTLPPLSPTHTRDGVRRERGGRSPVLSPASFDGSDHFARYLCVLHREFPGPDYCADGRNYIAEPIPAKFGEVLFIQRDDEIQ